VWSPDSWDSFVNEQINRLDGFSREGRILQRYLFGGAQLGELDRQGRVALPAPLLQHAQLNKDIVIAGLRNRLEIWDREAWSRQLAEFEGSAESVAERLAQSKP
jgi:MraZ protein